MEKIFTTEEIRNLYNRFFREEISFSEMVEIMNERVSGANEPQYKDGDFVVNECGVIIIFKNKVGSYIYDHAYFSEAAWVVVCSDSPTTTPIRGYATEEQKKKILDELAKEGKRWNEEEKCIEDIPVPKFRSGDKVRIIKGISSSTYYNVGPGFVEDMDDLIGKTMIVDMYTDLCGYVACEETEYTFLEEWLELYVEDMPKRKFKSGDKVRIKDGISSKTHYGVRPGFAGDMDDLIGKTMTIDRDFGDYYVVFEGIYWSFPEDWLEPYEELKEGDLAIFWDFNKRMAFIGEYNYFQGESSSYPHIDNRSNVWKNAIKFKSEEQYKKLLKGEI